MAELSGLQERLATDLAFFKQQSRAMLQATVNLHELGTDQTALKQLLRKEPQLLPQQAALTAAALQQLAVQLDREIEVCRTAAMLADTLGLLLLAVRARPYNSQIPCAADTANLTMLRDKGLLTAYSAAATAAAARLISISPQLPRADPTHATMPAVLQLMDNPAHVFAAASHGLVLLWDTIADLTPVAELLPAQSILQDSMLPTATLAMALARAYAGDKAFCEPVMYHVLTSAVIFSRGAVSGTHNKHFTMLAHQDVYELLLLCLAVGTGLLHAEYKGISKQSLLPSMRVTGSSSSSSSRGSKSRRLAVSSHHEELLHALLGVRQLAAMEQQTATTVSAMMWLIPHAVCEAGRVRMKEAASAQRASDSIRGGEAAPPLMLAGAPRQLVLPLLLTQVEVLALMPPVFSQKLPVLQQVLTIMAGSFDEMRRWIAAQRWQEQQLRNSPNSPSLRAVQTQLQQCVESLWLQLGPALLALCRRSSGEATGEDEDETGCGVVATGSGQILGAVPPREVFAAFSDMLISVMSWSVPDKKPGPTVNLAAVVDKNPLLALSIMEAAFHVLHAYDGPAVAVFNSQARISTASAVCFDAAIALPILAEATAARVLSAPQQAPSSAAGAASRAPGSQQAAAGASSSDSSKLEQKMFCLLVAAVKYVQYSAGLAGTGGRPEPDVLGPYFYSISLLCSISRAAAGVLGDADDVAEGFSALSIEQQLLWLHVLGRVVVAAGQLLQQVPQFVSAGGSFVRVDDRFRTPMQFSTFAGVTATVGVTVSSMQGLLQPCSAVALAVESGLPGLPVGAATAAELARLQQLGMGLQVQLAPLSMVFGSAIEGTEGVGMSAAMQQLHAACQQGGLPQQLRSFGVAFCAAFPQRGCCGNPACLNPDKFTETALASQGCSGCGKAVKFCSPACHKIAWKQGHKAACGVLKQRQAAASATAEQEEA